MYIAINPRPHSSTTIVLSTPLDRVWDPGRAGNLGFDSAVRLVCAPRHGVVDDRTGPLPPEVLPQQLVLGGRLVDRVRDPRVPPGLDMCGIEVVDLVVNPSRPQWKFLEVLVILVAKLVLSYEPSPFRVA
jgi:hypothetical protein